MTTIAFLFAILSALFWMFVGWRAMRAHERLADAAEQAVRKTRESEKSKGGDIAS